jgi:molybdopterin-guanine dinucleotide biosynthesis protein
MIERTFVQIGGRPKAGKTTLVEHLLRTFDGQASVARCIQADNLREPQETRPVRNVELRRYRAAGASDAVRYRFPASHADTEAFFLTDLMDDFTDSVILEGDRPIPYVDVSVFVAEPLEAGGTLLVRRIRDRAREAAEEIEKAERMLEEPDGVAKILEERFGSVMGAFFRRHPEELERFRAGLRAGVDKARQVPLPEPTKHWAVHAGYGGIEWSQVAVVNVRRDDQRALAEKMLDDLRRIRKDEEVFGDVLGLGGKRTPITAVVADLSDPKDPGTRKVVTRIKRSMRGG